MNLDTSCFKAFQCAAKTLNFTEAARQAGMTQSGVSQHIAKLEKEIDGPLFYRVGKRVLLTESGQRLLNFIDQYQDSLATLNSHFQNGKETLVGKVSYAMPESCLLSPHFSILLKAKLKHFPDIDLNVELHPSEQVKEKVLNNEIDFGFVTKKTANENLSYVEFCEEEYVLAGSVADRWISYPGFDVLYEKWLNENKMKKNKSVQIRGSTNSMNSALAMVAHGMGVSIFPKHCIGASEYKPKLKMQLLSGKPCLNMIYIVTLSSVAQPARVQKVIKTFLDMR